ncbi:MAG: DUF1700 domain-containing protein [Clostridia bacterium]|nr:DUF1700 domain-containing protein [Clostridia bacterium]
MNKQQFLTELARRLQQLPPADIARSLDYYAEMIDDRIEDGLSEEEAVGALGPIEEIAGQILMDAPLTTLVKTKTTPARRLQGWEIALLALGFPVWFPLLLAAAVMFFSIYVVLWAVVISLYAADLGIATSAIGCIAAGVITALTGNPAAGLVLWGAGLICIGLSMLFFYLAALAAKGAVYCGKAVLRSVKRILIGKGDSK